MILFPHEVLSILLSAHKKTKCNSLFVRQQVTATFLTNLKVRWPKNLANIIAAFGFFNFDFFKLPETECLLGDLDHLAKLLICSILPLILLAALAMPTCCYSVWTFISKASLKEKRNAIVAAFCFSSLSLLFLVYPMVSATVLGTFSCVTIDQTRWLMKDVREDCPIQSRLASFYWSIAFTVVYPAGVPLIFLSILYYFRVPRMATQKEKMQHLQAVAQRAGIFDSMSEQLSDWIWTSEPVDLLTRSQCKCVLQYQYKGQGDFEDHFEEDALGSMLRLQSEVSTGKEVNRAYNTRTKSGIDRVASTGPTAAEMTIDRAPSHGSINSLNNDNDNDTEADDSAINLDDLSTEDLRTKTAEYINTLCSDQVVVVPPVTWTGELGKTERLAIGRAGNYSIKYREDRKVLPT